MPVMKIVRDKFYMAHNLQICMRDHYDKSTLFTIKVPPAKPVSKDGEQGKEKAPSDAIVDICVSESSKYIAGITTGKLLFIYSTVPRQFLWTCLIPRAATKVRFVGDGSERHVLVADKTGDAYIYDITKQGPGQKILGHLSLLLDILIDRDSKYVITCDRDEKIKVSNYPNTCDIQAYCMGHKEFVTSIEFLPHNEKYLVSVSGDGTLKIWDYVLGKLERSVNVNEAIKDVTLLVSFKELMKRDDVEVECLPVTHLSCSKRDNSSSNCGVLVHLYRGIVVYLVTHTGEDITCSVSHNIPLKMCPLSLTLYDFKFWFCGQHDDGRLLLEECNLEDGGEVEFLSCELYRSSEVYQSHHQENIMMLYKKKFDNVHEYQERKRRRIEGQAE